MMVGGSSSCQAGDKTGATQLWPAEDNRTGWRGETGDQGGDQHSILQGEFLKYGPLNRQGGHIVIFSP